LIRRFAVRGRKMMRILGFIVGALALILSSGAQAQAWTSHYAVEDRFAIWFPSAPNIEETEWLDEYDNVRAARRYSAERRGSTYSVIAVDYSDADWDVLNGAYPHAASIYRQKGDVTYDGFTHLDRIHGHRLQITQDDGRRIYFKTLLHGGILYMTEAIVPARAAPPGQFEEGLQILDHEGVRVRYNEQDNRMPRTDDLQEALGGPDLEGPILSGEGDEYLAP
jgi:hypothetical protein